MLTYSYQACATRNTRGRLQRKHWPLMRIVTEHEAILLFGQLLLGRWVRPGHFLSYLETRG